MTLFNDPIRVQGGRVISLLPTHPLAAGCPRRGQTGPQRVWTLAYPSPSPAKTTRPS